MGKLKIVYPICCGMDVHRDFLIACIASTNVQGVTEYQSRRFSTYTGNLRKLRDWLLANGCKDVCMESTGKYWIPSHNILEESCHVVVSHPKFVKAIKGKKTDKKDAQWIADLFKHDLVRGSFIPPKDIRQLRDLCRYWVKLSSYMTGEKNRAQNCLTVSKSPCWFKSRFLPAAAKTILKSMTKSRPSRSGAATKRLPSLLHESFLPPSIIS